MAKALEMRRDDLGISAGMQMSFLEERFDQNIRPLLDAVDRLRTLKLTTEGIPLPSIVVVGDQSSGKSSVLESLATISLPRGQGIATRVPLVLRLQRSSGNETSINISYNDFVATIQEDDIEESVNEAQKVLAGTGKGVKDTPINLHIRRPGAPDLTMIDLPGITRVPVHGQPENIYEQISAMIKVYLEPKQTVILNVLSATADFSTCESIRMAQKEDIGGERTLAVVTKVDKCPEGLYEKVTENDVNIGLGYICVRNRTKEDKNHDEAREKERKLFYTHPELSKLDKSAVGIDSLAKRLIEIQADIIRRNFPEIQSQIEKTLSERQRELASLMHGVASGNSLEIFLRIVDDDRTMMENIIVHGMYERYMSDNDMHFPARLEEMFQMFNSRVGDVLKKILPKSKTEEILVRMTEMRGIMLPNFLPATLMRELVGEQIDSVEIYCRELVLKTHDFAQHFVSRIIDSSTSTYPKLLARYKHEARNVLALSQSKCMKFVERSLDKERSIVFTMNDYYINNVKKIKEKQERYRASGQAHLNRAVEVEGFQEPIALDEVFNASTDVQSAFEMKVNLAAYWKVVHKRMADEIPLEIRYSLQVAVLTTLRTALLGQDVVNNVTEIMEEHPSSVQKRINLKNRVELLMESRSVLSSLS